MTPLTARDKPQRLVRESMTAKYDFRNVRFFVGDQEFVGDRLFINGQAPGFPAGPYHDVGCSLRHDTNEISCAGEKAKRKAAWDSIL